MFDFADTNNDEYLELPGIGEIHQVWAVGVRQRAFGACEAFPGA
jgi:hypothetical protein